MSEGGEPSAPATPGLIPLSYTTPWDAALNIQDLQEVYSPKIWEAAYKLYPN